jgi:hypothetical protein
MGKRPELYFRGAQLQAKKSLALLLHYVYKIEHGFYKPKTMNTAWVHAEKRGMYLSFHSL